MNVKREKNKLKTDKTKNLFILTSKNDARDYSGLEINSNKKIVVPIEVASTDSATAVTGH